MSSDPYERAHLALGAAPYRNLRIVSFAASRSFSLMKPLCWLKESGSGQGDLQANYSRLMVLVVLCDILQNYYWAIKTTNWNCLVQERWTGRHYQVNCSGADWVPQMRKSRNLRHPCLLSLVDFHW